MREPNGDGADGRAIEDVLAAHLAVLLGTKADKVNRRRPLKRIGIDSLMMVDLRNRIHSDLGVQVPLVKLLSGESLSTVAAFVRAEIATRTEDREAARA